MVGLMAGTTVATDVTLHHDLSAVATEVVLPARVGCLDGKITVVAQSASVGDDGNCGARSTKAYYRKLEKVSRCHTSKSNYVVPISSGLVGQPGTDLVDLYSVPPDRLLGLAQNPASRGDCHPSDIITNPGYSISNPLEGKGRGATHATWSGSLS